MNSTTSPTLNVASFRTQLAAISQRLGVEPVPCFTTAARMLAYEPLDPKNPSAQKPIGVLIQTREDMSPDEFAKRLPFDTRQNGRHSLAVEWRAIQAIVSYAGQEAGNLADIVRGDNRQRVEAVSMLQSSMAPPAPGLSIVAVEEKHSAYRNVLLANIRSAMLLSRLLGESHVEAVADMFFQAAAAARQIDDLCAAAMLAEVSLDRVIGVDSFPQLQGRKAFAVNAWKDSIVDSDPSTITRFKLDRALHHCWSDASPMVMNKLYLASYELNTAQGLHVDAMADMLRAARLMLERGQGSLGEREVLGSAAFFMNKAIESGAKVPGITDKLEILKELHARAAKA